MPLAWPLRPDRARALGHASHSTSVGIERHWISPGPWAFPGISLLLGTGSAWAVELPRWAVSIFQRGPRLGRQRSGSHGDQPVFAQAPQQAAEPTVGGAQSDLRGSLPIPGLLLPGPGSQRCQPRLLGAVGLGGAERGSRSLVYFLASHPDLAAVKLHTDS